MATADSVLQILITATDQSGSVLTGVGSRVSTLADGARDVSQPFADLATAVAKLDAALAAMVGGGLALAITESGKFSGAFAEITTLFDAAPNQVGQFRDDILQFAKDSKSGLEDINGAVYAAISAGVAYSDSLGLVRQAEQTAIAGKAGLKDATVLLASSLNAYGKSAADAGAFSDALFVAVRDGQTTLPELSASLAQVTGVAAQSGVSFDDLLAAVAALTASGLPTSQAVTAIKGALTNILKPTKDAEEMAQKLGLRFDATALASKGLGGFMAELKDKAGGNIDAMSALFGSIEGLNGALILTGTGADKFGLVLDDMKNKAGATSGAYAKMAEEFDQTNQMLANNVKLTLIAVGDKVRDDYTDLVGALSGVFATLGDAVRDGTLDELFTVIEEAFNRAAAALKNLAQNLPEALGKIDLKDLAAAFGGMFDGVDLATADGLAMAIQSIVDTLESLVVFSRGLVDALRPFVEVLMAGVSWFNSLDDSTKNVIAGLTGVLAAVNLLSGPVSAVGTAIGTIGSALQTVNPENLDLLRGKITVLLPHLEKTVLLLGQAGLVAAAGAAGYAVGTVLNEGLNKITDWATGGEAQSLGEWFYNVTHAAEDQTEAAARLAEKYREITAATGVVIDSSQDLRDAVRDGKIYFDEATKSWAAGSGPLRDYGDEVRRAKETSADYRTELALMIDANGNLKGAVTGTITAVNGQTEALEAYYIQAGNSPEVARYMAQAEATKQEALKGSAAAADEAFKKTDAYRLKTIELASQERVKTLELAVEFNIEKLKADTKVAEAVIDQMGNTITSTGNLIEGLFGSLTNAKSFSDKWRIEEQISRENDRRDEALEQQKKLNQSVLDLNEEKLRQMKEGGALIKVEAAGLEPALEMILVEVLKAIQIRATEDQSALLLGAG